MNKKDMEGARMRVLQIMNHMMGKRVKLVVGTRGLYYLHPWSILGLYFVKIWVFGLYFTGQRPLNELGAIFIPKWQKVVACKIANVILIHGMLIWKKFQSSWVHQ